MNAPHLHLILNHVPTVGTAIALGLLLLSLLRRQDALRRVSLEVFFVIALITLPAYLSGVATGLQLEKSPDVSVEAIRKHHDGALVGFGLMLLTSLAAWLGLWQWRRTARPSNLNTGIVLVLALLTLTTMAGTATMGGEIRHPEIMNEGAAPTAGPSWISAAGIQMFVTDHTWLWPSLEALHFIGLWLLFGVVLVVNLRMLGMMKAASFSSLHRLLPWSVLGLGINIASGMMWVIATPEQYSSNVSFFWKMGFLLLAGLDLLYLTTFDEPWEVEAGQDASFANKAIAFSAIASWVCVMYFGRMLPFLGNAF
jgi:uncharacterized membrane protein